MARAKFEIMLAARWLRRRPDSEIFCIEDSPAQPFISAIYVINLDRQKKRWRNYVREARFVSRSGGGTLLEITRRFSAVDARNPRPAGTSAADVKDIYSLRDQYFVEPDERLSSFINGGNQRIRMSPQEIAVGKSHIGVWRRIVDEKRGYALVLEDDVYFDVRFAALTNTLWSELTLRGKPLRGFDLLYLSYREPTQGATKEHISDHIFRPIRGLWQLSGYVLSNKGAQKLLALLPLEGPVDMWMNRQFDKLDVLAASSSVIHQRFDWKSDNSYSIIAALERMGIKVPECPAEFARRAASRPVFGLGLSDPQAASMFMALSVIGYRACNVRLSVEDILKLLRDIRDPMFNAFLRLPDCDEAFQAVDALYPNTLYITSARSVEAREQASGAAPVAAGWARFKDHPERLLRFDFEAAEPWERLCAFLGCAIPDIKFPSPWLLPAQRAAAQAVPLLDRPWTTARLSEHDRFPWILPHRLNFGGFAPVSDEYRSIFDEPIVDGFDKLDRRRWDLLENSFPSNLAYFDTRNFSLRDEGGFRLTLRAQKAYDRDYASASLNSAATYLYGRFEAEMKPARGAGAISALFLHRFHPRQEIDIEFLGENTTQLLANVYYNPGIEGVSFNYGDRGAPISIPLGFDAADQFHRYAIEWTPEEVRWLVDGRIVHRRYPWGPSSIPDLPMKFFMNLWSCRHPKFGGTLQRRLLPLHVDVRCINISNLSAGSFAQEDETHEHTVL